MSSGPELILEEYPSRCHFLADGYCCLLPQASSCFSPPQGNLASPTSHRDSHLHCIF